MAASTSTSTTLTTAVTVVFDQFRKEIDDHNDTRERLIKVVFLSSSHFFLQNFDLEFFTQKASRDVTNLSKKTIFLLHRMALEASTDKTTPAKHAANHGYEKLRQIQAVFATLSTELQGDKFWRYHRQVSPGLQEYIEALGFAHFLDHGSLITFDQVQATLSDPEGIAVGHT